jgi:hypothetical protein
MPWLYNFEIDDADDAELDSVSSRIEQLAGIPSHDGYGGLEITAEISRGRGPETVLASFQQGLLVVDRAGQVVARARGFKSEGSADDLVALAVGDGQLDEPMIALAVTTGGHRDSVTSIVLYQLGENGRLVQVFAKPIVDRDGDQTFEGAIVFAPRALRYRSPRGASSLWRFDPARGQYVESAPAEIDRTVRDDVARSDRPEVRTTRQVAP